VRSRRAVLAGVGCALLLATGCGSDDSKSEPARDTNPGATGDLPQGSESVDLDPANFTTTIDNPYFPITPNGKPGSRWVYRGQEGGEEVKVEVTVTDEEKEVEGIPAVVVEDVVTGDGGLIEKTFDWYAQDKAGNVWYLGEDTTEYEGGRAVSTSGSWESGVDGAEAGIIMPAEPRLGLAYRQEHYEGEAEDDARVVGLDESVQVPFGSFDGTLKTRDTTPLEPNLVEFKYYAKDVGLVLKEGASGAGREELTSYRAAE
jgi:hypothetical protein